MTSCVFYPWYPRGVRSVVAGGGTHFIATIDETTVLKFPLVPQEEQTEHPTDEQRLRHSIRAEAVKGLEVEEQILRRLGNHHRIVQLKGKHEDGLLLEYLPTGFIERYLLNNAPDITIDQRLKWGLQAAEGLAYIHMKNVLHGDITLSNLLLDSGLSIKFCDFQGRLLHPDGHVVLDGGSYGISARSFMPRLDQDHQDRKTDIFAFGTALYIILTGQQPFHELGRDNEEEIERRFAKQEFPPLDQIPGGNVIRNCWTGIYDDASEAMNDLQSVIGLLPL